MDLAGSRMVTGRSEPLANRGLHPDSNGPWKQQPDALCFSLCTLEGNHLPVELVEDFRRKTVGRVKFDAMVELPDMFWSALRKNFT